MGAFFQQIPSSWLPTLSSLGAAVLIILLAFIVHGLVRRWIGNLRKTKVLSESVESLVRMLLRWTFVVLTTLLVLHQFGVLANVWAAVAAVLAMVAVGFVAVWSIASNLSATVLILITRPFSVGDEVELVPENVGGKVIDLNALFTTLRADDGSLVQLPNNLIFQRIIRRRPAGSPVVELGEQLDKAEPTE